MKEESVQEIAYRVIDSIISAADPAALGGTSGEYENLISRKNIQRFMMVGTLQGYSAFYSYWFSILQLLRKPSSVSTQMQKPYYHLY